MTEPEEEAPASAAALAGVASEVEALRRIVTPVAERVDELAAMTAELADRIRDLGARPSTRAMPSWLVAPADLDVVRDVLADLDTWLRTVFLRYADGSLALPECWLWHPDVVEELLWLMHTWLAAYQGEKASAGLVGDWHDRYRPGVVQRIRARAGACSMEAHLAGALERQYRKRRPDASALIAEWWANGRDTPAPEPAGDLLARSQPRRL
jgi:hypothetical protein